MFSTIVSSVIISVITTVITLKITDWLSFKKDWLIVRASIMEKHREMLNQIILYSKEPSVYNSTLFNVLFMDDEQFLSHLRDSVKPAFYRNKILRVKQNIRKSSRDFILSVDNESILNADGMDNSNYQKFLLEITNLFVHANKFLF